MGATVPAQPSPTTPSSGSAGSAVPKPAFPAMSSLPPPLPDPASSAPQATASTAAAADRRDAILRVEVDLMGPAEDVHTWCRSTARSLPSQRAQNARVLGRREAELRNGLLERAGDRLGLSRPNDPGVQRSARIRFAS